MEQFYFNGNNYAVQGIELHTKRQDTGQEEFLYFKDPTNIQCTTEMNAVRADCGGGIAIQGTDINHHVSFDCSSVSIVNVNRIAPVVDIEKATTPPVPEKEPDSLEITW